MEHRDHNGMEVLDDATCWSLVEHSQVGRLAVSILDHPDVFPINHVVDHGSIVFRSAEGTKLAAAVLGRGVAFEVDGYDAASGEAWSVVIKGWAHEIEKLDEVLALEDLPLFPWNASPKHRWVRVEADEISGRRFRVVDTVSVDR